LIGFETLARQMLSGGVLIMNANLKYRPTKFGPEISRLPIFVIAFQGAARL
jgi:hypothetical protein